MNLPRQPPHSLRFALAPRTEVDGHVTSEPAGSRLGMPRAERVDWVDHIVASRLQTIRDVAVARMGTVAVIAGDGDATPLLDELADSALADGFVVAIASLAESGLHDLHAVVG